MIIPLRGEMEQIIITVQLFREDDKVFAFKEQI